jgi:tetratricopeptide (TPR) repeat protein
MARLLSLILFFTLVATVVGLSVVYNKQINDFSSGFLVDREVRPYLEARDWPQATRILERALKERPGNLSAALTLAALYQRQGQYEKAESLYQQILKQRQDNLEARTGYAMLLRKLPHRMNDAVAQYRLALKVNRGDPKLLSGLGDTYKEAAENPKEQRPEMKRWLYEWAVYYYRIALRNDPNRFKTQFNLGVAYQELDDASKALDHYCKAIILTPESYEAHYNMGLVLVGQHFHEAGFRHLKRSVELLNAKEKPELTQQLAERVQIVKNKTFQAERSSRPDAGIPISKALKPFCLLSPAVGGEGKAHGS